MKATPSISKVPRLSNLLVILDRRRCESMPQQILLIVINLYDQQVVLSLIILFGDHLVEQLFDLVTVFTLIAVYLRLWETSLILAFFNDFV